MAMAGFHKGNNNGNRSGNNKPYGVMLLLAFGAALIGVMMIHKLRERRIFNLLVQEKDHQLISLQLLLQKEREYTKEMKRKAEEMKTKMYSLRNQNMETDRRVMEMQSTIQSLKDERKILESALEERQNHIKMNRKRIAGQEKENPQLTALMERLKQKEGEIEDLKRHLEISSRRWPAGTDNDVPNRERNFNMTGELHESRNYSNGVPLLERSIVKSENSGRLQNTSENKGSLSVNEENSTPNATRASVEPFQKLVNTDNTDPGRISVYDQEHTVATDEQMGLKNSEWDEIRNEASPKGGLKLEMADSSKIPSFSMKGRYEKEKRWRKLARNNRNDENSEAEGIKVRKIPADNRDQLRDREEGTTYNRLEVTKLEDLSNAKSRSSQNPEDSKDLKFVPVIEETVQHLKKPKVNGSLDGETIQYGSQENINRDMKMQNNPALKNTAKDERQEESEDADVEDGADMATGEFYRELLPDLEEDKEEYKEETEEPEF